LGGAAVVQILDTLTPDGRRAAAGRRRSVFGPLCNSPQEITVAHDRRRWPRVNEISAGEPATV